VKPLNSECSPSSNLDQTAPTTFLFWPKKNPQLSFFRKFSIFGKKKSTAVGVSNKHRLVNLYLCALGPDNALKDTRFILVRAECLYVQSVVARVISTKIVRSRGTNGRERDWS